MAFNDIISNYVVPIASGFFFLLFLAIFGWIVHKAVLKPMGFYGFVKKMIISSQKKKLLADEKLIEYCVARINLGLKEADVRSELLLANKYQKGRIDQICYAFNLIEKEMKG